MYFRLKVISLNIRKNSELLIDQYLLPHFISLSPSSFRSLHNLVVKHMVFNPTNSHPNLLPLAFDSPSKLGTSYLDLTVSAKFS